MMGNDARDMMGLPANATPKPAQPKAPPKSKVKAPLGIAREVLDLNFEGAPPISIIAPKFKEKPRLPFKPRRWAQTPFRNSARQDGLILHHWKREGETPAAKLLNTPANVDTALPSEDDHAKTELIADTPAVKWNLKVERPRYTESEYENHLKSDLWTKEETDYLVDLVTDLDLRWVIIADRYDYKASTRPGASSENTPIQNSFSIRSMEDIKARYYQVAAKCMAIKTPLSSMSSSEFEMHERMSKFDPTREAVRKQYAERLFQRSAAEAHEEELLLRELSRIVSNQEKLYQDRLDLYDRLNIPPPTATGAHASSSIYQTSQGLTQLMQSLLQQVKLKDAERKEKRRSALGLDTDSVHTLTPLDGKAPRSAISGMGGSNDKRSQPATPLHRHLSASERARFGVAYPTERFNSGVSFRHERVVKASQAKSTIQMTRIGDALAELGIPPRLFMPTAKVVAEYERLIEGVKNLVEVRKLREKLDAEIKVWDAQKGLAGDGPTQGSELQNGQGTNSGAEDVNDAEDVNITNEGDAPAEQGNAVDQVKSENHDDDRTQMPRHADSAKDEDAGKSAKADHLDNQAQAEEVDTKTNDHDTQGVQSASDHSEAEGEDDDDDRGDGEDDEDEANGEVEQENSEDEEANAQVDVNAEGSQEEQEEDGEGQDVEANNDNDDEIEEDQAQKEKTQSTQSARSRPSTRMQRDIRKRSVSVESRQSGKNPKRRRK